MNEHLQGGISSEKVWFASKIVQHASSYRNAMDFNFPYEFTDSKGELYTMVDFLSDQDDWIHHTKRQLALIEVKSTTLGSLQYEIPSHLRKSKSETRARRDNYTCLLLAYYASKHYFDILYADTEPKFASTFTPMFF
jgi:hypothetical protein